MLSIPYNPYYTILRYWYTIHNARHGVYLCGKQTCGEVLEGTKHSAAFVYDGLRT